MTAISRQSSFFCTQNLLLGLTVAARFDIMSLKVGVLTVSTLNCGAVIEDTPTFVILIQGNQPSSPSKRCIPFCQLVLYQKRASPVWKGSFFQSKVSSRRPLGGGSRGTRVEERAKRKRFEQTLLCKIKSRLFDCNAFSFRRASSPPPSRREATFTPIQKLPVMEI